MKMKKIMSTILASALLCSSLTACDSKNEAPKEVVELTFWHLMSGTGEDALKRQVDTFNNGIGAEKGIKVNPVYIDWPGTASFATALEDKSSDSMPDVFQLYGNMVSYVTELDDVVWADDEMAESYCSIKKEDFIPSTLDAFTIDGKLLALPYAISSMLLFYNKTYLEEAGYSAPPSTIDEMANMLNDIADKTDAEYGLHAKITDYELEHFLATQGDSGSYITDNNNGRNGNVTEIVCKNELSNFLNEWDKVVKTNAVNQTTRSTTEEFASGIDAMELMTSARIAAVDELVGDSFEWGVAPIPKVSSSDIGGSNVYGSSLVMFNHNNDKRTQATWEFMEYLISAEAQTMLMEDMGYLPVNVHALDYEPYKKAVEKQSQLGVLFGVLNAAPNTAISVFFPNSSDVDAAMTNNIERFCNGEISSDEAANGIITDCNKVLDEYYRTNQ